MAVILALFDVFCLLGLIEVLFSSGKDKGADIALCLVFIVPVTLALFILIMSIRMTTQPTESIDKQNNYIGGNYMNISEITALETFSRNGGYGFTFNNEEPDKPYCFVGNVSKKLPQVSVFLSINNAYKVEASVMIRVGVTDSNRQQWLDYCNKFNIRSVQQSEGAFVTLTDNNMLQLCQIEIISRAVEAGTYYEHVLNTLLSIGSSIDRLKNDGIF